MSRTFGETKNCAGCRYWSEMLAQAIGGGPVEAMCLADRSPATPFAHEYTIGSMACNGWKSGEFGAIDDPDNRHENPYKETA